MKHLKQYLSCFLVIAMLISTVNISNAVEFDNYENEQEQVEVSESIESLQDETMEIESSETDLNVFDEFDSLLEENKNTDISLLSIQKGSQTVNTGSGGRYNWKEIIVYHSNYPNAEDVEFIVYYNIQHLVNFYSTGQLEVFNALGFEIPDGYELKKVIWNTKADGTGKGYINSFAFDIKNNNKATHLYAQYEEDYSNFYRYQLNFDFNGGIWHEKESHTETQKFKDSGLNLFLNAKYYPHPEKEGYIFDGWDYEGNGSYDEDENSVFMEGILGEIVEGTLTARWRKEDIKPNNTFNLVKTFEGIDNIPENFEMKYNVICENTAEGTLECNGVLTYENGNVNLEEKTITWKVPYFYGYSNNINIITLTEINADVDGYIYYPFNTLGSTSILEDNTIQINLSSMASGATIKFSNIYENENLKVTWYDEDRTTILDTNTFLADSTEPEFRYELPKKEKDENYIYEFKEWIKLDIPLNDDTISYVAEYEKIEIKTIPVTISTTFQNEISLSHPTLDDISKDFHMEYNYIDEDGEHNGILSYEEAQKSLTSSGYPILTWNPISIKTKNIKGDKLNINLKQNNYLVNNAEYVRTYSSDGGNRQNGTGIISVSCASNALQNTINNYYQESEKKYGFYIVNHEYYTKDKNGNLALDRTISDKPVTLESGTILNTYTIKQKPEADYNFSEISENTITIEADIQKTVTIKYIREEKYGSYIVKHEYYVKDKDGNLILENTVSNDISNTVVDTIIDANEIEQILEHNNHIYEFSEHTGNITIEESSTKEIIFKYIREEKYGSYQVKHEYYIRDKEGNVSLENVKEEDTISDVVVGTLIKSSEQKQYLEFNKKTYSLLEEANDTIIEENKVSEIIFKYVREKEYGSYVVKHNYYLKDKNGNFILEETVSENPILTEPGNIIGLKDTDIIIPQKLKDRYTLKDASENMIIEANGETEFIVNYFREEPIILKYGSYQVVHQYYLDDTLEATINEELVSNVLAGTSIGIIDTDIIISKKENHDNKEYIFDSVDKAIIKEDETVIVTIKYIRKNQSVVEPVSVTITANKELKNASLKENQFSFRLSNNVDTYIASNDVNGNISFKPITFNREGTYKYYLTEDNTKEANIKYDSSIYDVEITVSKSKNSLIAIVKYLRDGKEVEKAVFTNSYKEPEQVTQPPSEENTNNNETITVIPEEEPPKIIVKQPQNQNKNDDFIEIEDEPVPKAIQPSQTGDDSQIFMYIILLILSGFCLFIKNKKK